MPAAAATGRVLQIILSESSELATGGTSAQVCAAHQQREEPAAQLLHLRFAAALLEQVLGVMPADPAQITAFCTANVSTALRGTGGGRTITSPGLDLTLQAEFQQKQPWVADIFWATDRALEYTTGMLHADPQWLKTADAPPRCVSYGSKPASRMLVGTVEASHQPVYPCMHVMPRMVFVSTLCVTQQPEEWLEAMTAQSPAAPQPDLLLHVHGYGTSLGTALKQAAHLKAALRYQGPVLAFAWRSAGSKLRYAEDCAVVDVSADRLCRVRVLHAQVPIPLPYPSAQLVPQLLVFAGMPVPS